MLRRKRAPRFDEAVAVRRRQSRRQFATNSATWRRIREAQLNEEPLCRYHARRGQTVAANEVDHRDGDATNNDPDNLQSLCKPCHSAKTAREQGGVGRRRT